MNESKRFVTPLIPMQWPYQGFTTPNGTTGLGTSTLLWNAPATAALYIVPFEFNVYPTQRSNQAILYWLVKSLPTGASYIQCTPVAVPTWSVVTSATAPTYAPNLFLGGQADFRFYSFEFDDLTTAANTVIPNRYTIKKTAADPTVTIQGQAINMGTRHPLPLCDEIPCFLIQHDGTAGPATAQQMAMLLVFGEA